MKIKVISVESKLDGDTEIFILKSDETDNITVELSRKRQPKTFRYLMNCLRDNSNVNKNKLFMEFKNDSYSQKSFSEFLL